MKDLQTKLNLNLKKLYRLNDEIHIFNLNKLITFNFLLQIKTYSLYIKPLFIDLFGVDLLGRRKKNYRFDIYYIFNRNARHEKMTRLLLTTNRLVNVNSIDLFFKGANWPEREVWDLFGVYFDNSSDMRRLLTDYGFSGYPMRKDFPLVGYYETAYNSEKKIVNYTDISLEQENRIFDFTNVWINTDSHEKKLLYD